MDVLDTINVGNIIGILDHVGECDVTVFGDFALDKYLYIDPARDEISVETGLPAYQVDSKAVFGGAAGTIVNNLRALGARVRCVGLIGTDGEGYDLMGCLARIGADTSLMIQSDMIQTYVYMKPMRLSPGGAYVESNRFDFRNFKKTPRELEDRLFENLEAALAASQGVVICDQYLESDNAAITSRIRGALAGIAARHAGKPFFADSRGFTGSYRGVIIKCNRSELDDAVKIMSGMPTTVGSLPTVVGNLPTTAGSTPTKAGSSPATAGGPQTPVVANGLQAAPKVGAPLSSAMTGEPLSSLDDMLTAAGELLAANGKAVVVTAGAEGAYVFEGGATAVHVPPFPVKGPLDITGAGDATNAGSIIGLVSGLSLQESVYLGGCVSSITIQQLGVTGTATVEQVKRRLAGQDGLKYIK
ncbi:MAG: PfkB family carbohydrate kinase [Oscillospiraceae bacterium]|nr:PfkB family carbohydrate kinase [Oscillospiraceae bacterium]